MAWHLDRLIEEEPVQARWFRMRDRPRDLGDWRMAAADLTRATELSGAGSMIWSDLDLVLWHLKDKKGRDRAVRALLERFGKKDLPLDAAWIALRTSELMFDPARAVELGQLLATRRTGRPGSLTLLGAALHCAWQEQRGRRAANEAIQAGQGRGLRVWAAPLFLAMAHHQLGHVAEARQSLDRALSWLRKAEGTMGRGWFGNTPAWEAVARQEFLILRQEAR